MGSVDNDTLCQIYQIVKLLGIALYSMIFHGPDMHICYRNDLQKLCIVLFCPVWTNSHCINGWPMWQEWCTYMGSIAWTRKNGGACGGYISDLTSTLLTSCSSVLAWQQWQHKVRCQAKMEVRCTEARRHVGEKYMSFTFWVCLSTFPEKVK